MVEIETFLRRPDGTFLAVGACCTAPADLDYIEGAIRICVDGVEIIGLEHWDYVDQLWCYIAEMVARLRSYGYAETCFPDQPINLSMQVSGVRTLVVLKAGEGRKQVSALTTDLLKAVKYAGLSFFDKMSELAPGISYADGQERLSSL
ncbi:hypothetical protein SAMN05421505_15220 [Sinosporangium album]|uniref:Uncharacterized protein n=1 Tax=Sinosporangium album TaxID=504805 RepID=A0A1G8KM10_9ACTN|nr:hypothetical protein [Sinosporangium album]SDI44422.1 hypothetical protein SAMN05421505_15220 [Sinosporangium album]